MNPRIGQLCREGTPVFYITADDGTTREFSSLQAAQLAVLDDAIAAAPPATQTYSGRPGCACGCRGTYRPATAANVKAMYTRMRATLERDPAATLDVHPSVCIWVETETRVNAVRFD